MEDEDTIDVFTQQTGGSYLWGVTCFRRNQSKETMRYLYYLQRSWTNVERNYEPEIIFHCLYFILIELL